MAVFWVVAQCSLADIFEFLKVLVAGIVMSLKTEAVSTSETSVNLYRTTRRYNPEDSHPHTRRRKNVKCKHF
jgi:hypothetical protein